MSGIVGVISDSFARSMAFTVSITGLQVPVNTSIRYAFGSGRAVSRNNLVRACLEDGAEWMWFVDTDHAFDAHILKRLLSHEKDIVAGLYLQRIKPFAPTAYDRWDDEEGVYWPIDLTKYEKDDLVPIRAAGTGGMLIRSEVFRAMKEPWFEVTEGLGSEDLPFCEKARELGFEIFVDLGARLGHADPILIWPAYFEEEKEWE